MTTPTDDSTPEGEQPVPRTLSCPSCGADFVVGASRCGSCDLPLTGPLAVRLWEIDQELDQLNARRRVVLESLRTGESPTAAAAAAYAARPTVATAAGSSSAYSGANVGRSDPWSGAPAARAPSAPSGGATGQQLLLAMGVLLLFIASIVFVAVAWDALGVYGRLGALVVAIAACAGLSAFCSARRLSASAEAFAVLAIGLSVVGLSAAYALDLFGAGDLSVRVYVAFAAAGLFGLTAALHPGARPVMTYPLVALVAAWAAAVAALADDSAIGWAAALTAGWLVVASPLTRWCRSLLDPSDQLLGPDSERWAARGASAGSWWAPLWPIGLLSGVGGVGVATVIIGSARA